MSENSYKPSFSMTLVAGPQAGGVIPVAGIMTSIKGEFMSTVRGAFPPDFFGNPPRGAQKRGRPVNYGRHVSRYLHEKLVQCISRHGGGSKKHLRTAAAELMGLGSAESGEKEIRDFAKSKPCRHIAEGSIGVLKFVPDGSTVGAVAMMIEKGANFERTAQGVEIDGNVWIVKWGDREAKHVYINTTIPFE